MEKNDVGHFISDIQATLAKNGFPEKKVALPLEKMYEVAHEKGINFNKVLEFLKEKGVDHSKTNEKIIFFKAEEIVEAEVPNIGGFDPSALAGMAGMDMGQMMKAATDMMKNMSPDQLKNIKDQIGNMSPDQIDGMKNMFGSLSNEEKSDLAKKAKDFIK